MKHERIYRLSGIDSAMHMLRPGARWEITNNKFTVWEDPRPCPTWQEVEDTMEKARKFEESVNTIWTEEQIKEILGEQQTIKEAIGENK